MLNRIRSRVMPALLTTMPSPPRPSAVSTSSSAVARSLMPPATATPLEPAEAISSMTSDLSSAAPMSLTTTVAPARARPTASARPRPAAAPVTTATYPERSVAADPSLSVVNLRIPLVPADQGSSGAFGDRLLRHFLLVGRHRVRLHHGVVLVVEIKQVRRNSDAHRVALTAVAVHFNSHPNLLADPPSARRRCGTALDPKTRTCYNRL